MPCYPYISFSLTEQIFKKICGVLQCKLLKPTKKDKEINERGRRDGTEEGNI